MRHISRLIPLLVVGGVVTVVALAARSPMSNARHAPEAGIPPQEIRTVVASLDAAFARLWDDAGVVPAKPAPDLQILRRLSLALHGTVPSLEEIRRFEADDRPDRLDHWTRAMLADRRFADYFAERLARSFVGKEQGQFIVFRRDRFVNWLSEELQKNTPYDQIVRSMIAQTGLWTGTPATNFVTAAVNDGDIDENKLAGKTVRAFLGQRIDCAQCHDHPFEHWKQGEFEGLAAFYGQAKVSVVGVEDKTQKDGAPVEYAVEDRKTLEKREVAPTVPFHSDWLPGDGSRRERLAAWVTHPENRRFERAIANRVWGLLFGRPYSEKAFNRPVDDLPDPPEKDRDVLDLLGADFRDHRCNLRRLIQVIASSQVFRLDSEYEYPTEPAGSFGEQLAEVGRLEGQWAVFPLVRLRPEQVIGAILQSGSIQTIDQNSHLFFRIVKFFQSNQFVEQYGDLGETELQDRGGTIPQRLLMLNGELAGKATEANPISAVGRIAAMASTDRKCVETLYLTLLSRRPSPAESAHFIALLAGANKRDKRRTRIVEDIAWTLFNSTEFSWNH